MRRPIPPQAVFAVTLALLCANARSYVLPAISNHAGRVDGDQQLPHRVALFTSSDPEGKACEAIRDVLIHYNIKRTEFRLSRSGFPGPLPLRAGTGKPLFGLVVFCKHRAAHAEESGSAGDDAFGMTFEQWQQLHQFEADFGVRRVSFGVDPLYESGVRRANTTQPKCCEDRVEQRLKWFPPEALDRAGVGRQFSAAAESVPSAGARHFPAQVVDSQNVVPFLAFEPLPPSYPGETVAAVVIHKEHADHMSFFFDAEPSLATSQLADMWLQWGLRTERYFGYAAFALEQHEPFEGNSTVQVQSSQDAVSPSLIGLLPGLALGLGHLRGNLGE